MTDSEQSASRARYGIPTERDIERAKGLADEIPEQTDCDHDWRVQPDVVLLSDPPQERLVCAKCGAVSSRTVPGYEGYDPLRSDPSDWPKAED